jgi:hypothetical protein
MHAPHEVHTKPGSLPLVGVGSSTSNIEACTVGGSPLVLLCQGIPRQRDRAVRGRAGNGELSAAAWLFSSYLSSPVHAFAALSTEETMDQWLFL